MAFLNQIETLYKNKSDFDVFFIWYAVYTFYPDEEFALGDRTCTEEWIKRRTRDPVISQGEQVTATVTKVGTRVGGDLSRRCAELHLGFLYLGPVSAGCWLGHVLGARLHGGRGDLCKDTSVNTVILNYLC